MTVLCCYYPHLVPRLFLYQNFLTLKSRSFQTTAWLHYDTEFCLKLADNDFEEVDTELWVSCFVADSFASTPVQPPPLACYAYHPPVCCVPPAAIDRYPPTCWSAQSRPLASSSRELPVAPTEEQQEPCFIFNDKGRCFQGTRCPYAHPCTHCGDLPGMPMQVFTPSNSPASYDRSHLRDIYNSTLINNKSTPCSPTSLLALT